MSNPAKITDKDLMRMANSYHSTTGKWPDRIVTTPSILRAAQDRARGARRYMRGPYLVRGNVLVVADVRCPPNVAYINDLPDLHPPRDDAPRP